MLILKNKIDSILKEKGMSVKRLAETLDMRYETVRRIVTADYVDTTTVINLYRIALELDVELEDLFEFDVSNLIEEAKENLNRINLKEKGDVNMERSELINNLWSFGNEIQKSIMKKKGYKEFSRFSNYMTSTMYKLQYELRAEDKNKLTELIMLLCQEADLSVDSNVLTALQEEDWTTLMYSLLSGLLGEEQ